MNLATCGQCQQPLQGRQGKKFCNTSCRSRYHQAHKRKEQAALDKVNSILLQNRKILKALCPNLKSTVLQAELEWNGFNFKYYTHSFQAKNGNTYFFCYDYGYLFKPDNSILIVKQNLNQLP